MFKDQQPLASGATLSWIRDKLGFKKKELKWIAHFIYIIVSFLPMRNIIFYECINDIPKKLKKILNNEYY